MNQKFYKKLNDVALELAIEIKRDNKPSPYAYMTISSAALIELFFTAVTSVKPEDYPFSTKKQYEKNIAKLNTKQIKHLLIFFMLDYIAFLKLEMNPKFFETFPVDYDSFVEGFKVAFQKYPEEIKYLDKTIDEYEKPFHPRNFLQRTGLPKEQDDTFFIHTLNELKFELFHQFNKNNQKLLKAASKMK